MTPYHNSFSIKSDLEFMEGALVYLLEKAIKRGGNDFQVLIVLFCFCFFFVTMYPYIALGGLEFAL